MDVRIIRSDRRLKTVSARDIDGVIEVRAPGRLPEHELTPIIERLVRRLTAHRAHTASDAGLERLAHDLNRAYFNGALRWSSIRWVDNQRRSRWGSCTPSHGTIRLSRRLATAPDFVIRYVLIHELAHLIEPNHGPRFQALVNRFPRAERARGYLMALGAMDPDALETESDEERPDY